LAHHRRRLDGDFWIGDAPEQSDDKKAPRMGAMSPTGDLSLSKEIAEGMELLAKIYKSGNQIIVRTINSNLAAFS